jgi:2-methylcitrate dehydratase PrpD
VTADLGETFEILRTSVKPHACCRYMQTPIDALLDLARKYDIQGDSVMQIEIAVLEAGWPLVCEPRGRKYKPETMVDAQFSMPFGAAIAIQYRAAGLDQFTEENLKSVDIRRLMGRVVLTKDIRIEKNFPAEWRSRVVVYLSNGEHYENYVRHPKGDPENPLTWDELIAKYRALTKPVLPPEKCEQIETAVRGLSQSSVLQRIWSLGGG